VVGVLALEQATMGRRAIDETPKRQTRVRAE